MVEPPTIKLPRGAQADDFIELVMKHGSWEREGIPETGCWLRISHFDELVRQGGKCNPDLLVFGLMDWLDVTDDPQTAQATLRLLLDRHYPADAQSWAKCNYLDEHEVPYRFIAAPVDPALELVSWQRDEFIFALGQRSSFEEGRLTVAAPGPISRATASRIFALSMLSYMGSPFDSFAGAVSMAGSTGNFYSWHRGELTTHHWRCGLGIHHEDERIGRRERPSQHFRSGKWLAPNQLAVQVAIGERFRDG